MTTLPAPIVPTELAEMAWQFYEQRKAEFIERNPEATPEQVEEHCKRIAREEGL